jgi:hypothetical protein
MAPGPPPSPRKGVAVIECLRQYQGVALTLAMAHLAVRIINHSAFDGDKAISISLRACGQRVIRIGRSRRCQAKEAISASKGVVLIKADTTLRLLDSATSTQFSRIATAKKVSV